jgi:hypothetical protein
MPFGILDKDDKKITQNTSSPKPVIKPKKFIHNWYNNSDEAQEGIDEMLEEGYEPIAITSDNAYNYILFKYIGLPKEEHEPYDGETSGLFK